MKAVKYKDLSWQERKSIRLQYIEFQNGKCLYCEQDLTKDPPTEITNKSINWRLFPSNFLQHPIHLQHCHKTGLTEGAVHAYCNAVMWQYEHR